MKRTLSSMRAFQEHTNALILDHASKARRTASNAFHQALNARSTAQKWVDSFMFHWKQTSLLGKSFLGMVLVESTFLIIMSLNMIFLAGVEKNCFDAFGQVVPCSQSTATTYGFVFIQCCIFLIIFAFNGIWRESVFELVAFMFGSILITTYSIFHFLNPSHEKPEEILSLLVAVLSQLGYFFMIYPVVKEFGYKTYLCVGADKRYRAMYRNYNLFRSMIRFNIHFGITASIFGGLFAFDENSVSQNVENVVILCMAFLWAYLGLTSVRHARKKLFIFFILFSFANPIYLATKLDDYLVPNAEELHQVDSSQFLALGFLSISLRLFVIGLALWTRKFFDLGIKQLFDQIELVQFKSRQKNISDMDARPRRESTVSLRGMQQLGDEPAEDEIHQEDAENQSNSPPESPKHCVDAMISKSNHAAVVELGSQEEEGDSLESIQVEDKVSDGNLEWKSPSPGKSPTSMSKSSTSPTRNSTSKSYRFS